MREQVSFGEIRAETNIFKTPISVSDGLKPIQWNLKF